MEAGRLTDRPRGKANVVREKCALLNKWRTRRDDSGATPVDSIRPPDRADKGMEMEEIAFVRPIARADLSYPFDPLILPGSDGGEAARLDLVLEDAAVSVERGGDLPRLPLDQRLRLPRDRGLISLVVFPANGSVQGPDVAVAHRPWA